MTTQAAATTTAGRRQGRGLGFAAGAATRLTVAAIYAVLAVAAVLLVERLARPRPAHATLVTAPAQPGSGRPATLVITPTFVVGRWLVMADGRALVADRSDAQGWRGAVDLAALGRTLLVEAEPADAAPMPAGALRVEFRVGDVITRTTAWGEGLISATIAVPAVGP